MYKVELTPEISKLAQASAMRQGVALRDLLARTIVEQSIMEIDPELNLVLDPEQSLSETAFLAKAGANDVVVNDKHIHVVALDENSTAELPNGFLAPGYIDGGALVVQLENDNQGTIVGHIGGESLLQASGLDTNTSRLHLTFQPDHTFDLARTLQNACSATSFSASSEYSPQGEELVKFAKSPADLPITTQRQIVSFACKHAWARNNLREFAVAQENLPEILEAGAIWAGRVDSLLSKLSSQSRALSAVKLRKIIEETGEKFGGQPESPLFRQALLQAIARAELASRLSPEALLKVTGVVDLIVGGQSVMDGVKSFVQNPAAVELARNIALKRESLKRFSQASADEIATAFQSLALQPAYATHSAEEELEMEAINQALLLVETGNWLQSINEDI